MTEPIRYLDDVDELLRELPPEKKEYAKKKIERDLLTNTYNKEAFESRLEKAILKAQSGRDKNQLIVLMMDLDGFGDHNKTVGHLTANKTLVEIIDEIRKVLRPIETDNLGRFGGDEFTFYFFGPGIDAGYSVAERARKAVAEKFEKKHSITLSVGVAAYQPVKEDTRTLKERGEAVLQEANKAMLLVKQEGKNGVEPYNPKN